MLNASKRESIFGLKPGLAFSILAAISVAIWWRALLSTFALALRDDQYTQILLIIPVSLALIFLDWQPPEPSAGSSVSVGSALIVVAILLVVLARIAVARLQPDEHLALSMLAFVLWVMGAFTIAFGTSAFGRALFPLCFLLGMVPFPDFLLNPIVRMLQAGSAASARVLFAAVGIPVVQEGTQITIPGLTMEVAQECSSIRSSLMLVVTTMIVAQVLLRTAWRKAVVVAVAIPLSVAKNGLRIFVLGVLATRVDRSFLTGRLHHQGGILYFLIALAVVFLLIWIARRGENKTSLGVIFRPRPT